MNALLICPADRPAVSFLAETGPLAVVPVLGKPLLEYWLEALVARGARHVAVLAADRPHEVRAAVGDGSRWGLKLQVVPENREPTADEAGQRLATRLGLGRPDVVVTLDTLPDFPELPLFDSYEGWFQALQRQLPRALTPARIGVREVQPGVWVSLHAQVAPTARLQAPCWVGEHAILSDQVVVGPGAIVEDRVVLERGAQVVGSIVGPDTFVGRNLSVRDSLAQGGSLVSWRTGSCLRVPDPVLMSSLAERPARPDGTHLLGRTLALAAMIASAPVALGVMALSLVRGENPLQLRLGVRPQRRPRSAALQTFAYYELTGGSNWLKRWPQFWSVVRGDLAWVGNRPLRPTQALTLANDFERLWLAAPVGLVSLADAHGCTDGLSDEVCAHASYYAVNASRRLDWFVLSRALFRAAAAIPIRRRSRKAGTVPLPHLVPKQEG